MRVKIARFICLLVCLTIPQSLRAEDTVQRLIDQLLDVDPALRQQAADRLVQLGENARAELVAAATGDDPRLAPRAAEVLLQMPFWRDSDPPELRELLRNYGQLAVQERQGVAEQIALTESLPPAPRAAVLARLMQEDPSPQVGWRISQLFGGQEDEFWRPLLNMDPTRGNAPSLTTAARAHYFVDRPRAIGYLNRAAEMEQRAGVESPGTPLIHELLAVDAIVRGDFVRARDCYRVLASAEPTDESAEMSPLLGFYGCFGALPGLCDDLAELQDELGRPEHLYALARMFNRPGTAPVSRVFQSLALLRSGEPAERFQVCTVLLERGWLSEARLELTASLGELSAAEKTDQQFEMQYFAYYRLWLVNRDMGDVLTAAESLEQCLKMLESVGRGGSDDAARMRASATALRLRNAVHRGDKPAVEKHLDELGRANAEKFNDADGAIDAVLAFRQIGDESRADAILESVANQHRAMMQPAMSPNPTAMNNLAWLLANCDRDLDEAAGLIARSLRADPLASSSIDTAAEVAFRRGEVDRAIELEKLALALRPGDHFMTRQLKRFRDAKNSPR